MAGIFQVYAIEGRSTGTKDGLLLTLEDGKKLIFDGDFAGFEAADAKYRKLIDDAIKEGSCFHSCCDLIASKPVMVLPNPEHNKAV